MAKTRKNLTISPEAMEILVTKDNMSEFASESIVEKHNNDLKKKPIEKVADVEPEFDMSMVIKQADYATLKGLSRQRIGAMIKAGKLKTTHVKNRTYILKEQ